MPTRTVSNAGGNWNATTTWVGGVVPLQNDDVVFTATSGNLVVNVSTQRLLSINFTNYVNTITFNNVINVLGTINLGTGGYTQAGSSGFSINGTSTLISNGVIWSRTILFTSGLAATFTLSDTWNVTGNITMSLSAAFTFNGNTLNIGGSLSVSNTNITSGTTVFVFNGTGTWSHSSTGVIRNNVTINTTGTLTISGNVYYNTGTLTYIAGTVITTGSSLNYTASVTLDTNGIIWNNINSVNPNSASAVTLLSDLTVSGTFFAGGTSNTTPYNTSVGAKIIILGNIQTGTVGGVSGTANIEILGTGSQTWSGAGTVRNNLTINKSTGTLTISGSVAYSTGTLTYITGKIITKNRTLNIVGLCTLINCHKINFDRVIITAGVTVTMNEFFSGSPNLKTTISSTGTNYLIAFQDGFEKIAKFVNITRATINNRNQLLILTDSKKSSSNIGIRYINQSPNGIAKGDSSIQNILTPGLNTFLISDPSMTIK